MVYINAPRIQKHHRAIFDYCNFAAVHYYVFAAERSRKQEKKTNKHLPTRSLLGTALVGTLYMYNTCTRRVPIGSLGNGKNARKALHHRRQKQY